MDPNGLNIRPSLQRCWCAIRDCRTRTRKDAPPWGRYADRGRWRRWSRTASSDPARPNAHLVTCAVWRGTMRSTCPSGRKPGDARAAPVTNPEMALGVDRQTVGIARRPGRTGRRGAALPDRPPLELWAWTVRLQGIDGVDRRPSGLKAGPLVTTMPSRKRSSSLPSQRQKAPARLGLVVVHGAEIDAPSGPTWPSLMRLLGLSGVGRDDGLDLAAPEVEPDEARLEPGDHDIGVGGQRHEADRARAPRCGNACRLPDGSARSPGP